MSFVRMGTFDGGTTGSERSDIIRKLNKRVKEACVRKYSKQIDNICGLIRIGGQLVDFDKLSAHTIRVSPKRRMATFYVDVPRQSHAQVSELEFEKLVTIYLLSSLAEIAKRIAKKDPSFDQLGFEQDFRKALQPIVMQ